MVTDECTPCTSIKAIPMEVYEYKQNIVPNHPGKAFTVDVMKECKKIVVVAADNFSGFITTAFVNSEKEADLRDGIIKTVCPFMASSLTRIRVDRAPGFVKLSKKAETLAELNIDMELGECKNKDALSIVDQKMKELRLAIKKISPSHSTLNQMTLSKATTTVNETIRHHTLSAKEIQFSRDLASTDNLKLDDEIIKEEIDKNRAKKNPSSAKAKSTFNKPAERAEANVGQLVFLKREGSKNQRRDLYMVIEIDRNEDSITICKIRDAISNKPASMVPHDPRYRYKVRQTDIMLAPNQPPPPVDHNVIYETDDLYSVGDTDMVPQMIHTHEEQQEEHQKQFRNHPPHHTHNHTTNHNYDDADEEEEDIWFEYNIVPINEPAENVADDGDSESNFLSDEEYEELQWEDIDDNQPEEGNINEEQEAEVDEARDVHEEEEQVREEHEEEQVDQVHVQPDIRLNVELPRDPVQLHRPKFPVRGQFIKYKRQVGSWLQEDFHILTHRFTLAQVTARLKPDKHGRVYFNIRFQDDSEGGIYLARGKITINEFIWDIIEEADMKHLQQLDGVAMTPDTLSPHSHPAILQLSISTEQAWDHSPERLAEDEAFLWEDTPLRALSVQDMLGHINLVPDGNGAEAAGEEDADNPEEEVTSPLGTFKRRSAVRSAVRRRQASGFSSNLVSQPKTVEEVQLTLPNNLNLILAPRTPIVAESVVLDRSQDLSLVLDASEDLSQL